jgi:hypothetical protein
MKTIPNTNVVAINKRYALMFRCLKDLSAICIVMLLATITAVEPQKISGISICLQPTRLLFTINALVSPANIIRMLAIATHNVNL